MLDTILDDIELDNEPECVNHPLETSPDAPNEFVVEAGEGARLDKFLASKLSHVSREKIKQAIQAGQCRVDDEILTEPKSKVRAGQHIELTIWQEPSTVTPVAMELSVYYKDADVAIVNKPAGLTVHPCPSCKETTFVHGLLHEFPQLAEMGGFRPGIVHRLDKNTSGLMVVALTEPSRLTFSQAFADRQIHKTYLAVVHGVPPTTGECRASIGRHPTQKIKMAVVEKGRDAYSSWQVLYADQKINCSLVAVTIHTGRTHQIRVHMSHIGHPLVGDALYAQPQRFIPIEGIHRQMLHAWRLEIPVRFFSDTPDAALNPESNQTPLNTVSHETQAKTKDAQNSSVLENHKTFVCPPPQDFIDTTRKVFVEPVRAVITGCPGSGKSAVLNFLAEKGCATCSADEIVKQLYETNFDLKKQLFNRFGSEILCYTNTSNPDLRACTIHKAKLFALMLEDESAKRDVDRIIHPFVYEEIHRFFSTPPASAVPVLVAEIPLWFESCCQGEFAINTVIGVDCPNALRHERLKTTRAWQDLLISTMDGWQLPQNEKIRKCTLIVKNDRSFEQLLEESERLLQLLINKPEETEQRLFNLMGVKIDVTY